MDFLLGSGSQTGVFHDYPESLLKQMARPAPIADSGGLGWDLTVCISEKSDNDAAGPRSHSEDHHCKRIIFIT